METMLCQFCDINQLFVCLYNGNSNHKFSDELVPSRQTGKATIELCKVIKDDLACRTIFVPEKEKSLTVLL